jgi:hypothetical protein
VACGRRSACTRQGPVHLDDVFVSPSLASGQAHVEATVSWAGPVAGRLICTLLDPKGRQVAHGEDTWSASSSSDGPKTLQLTLPVPDPQPWTPEKPDLYTSRIEVWNSETLSDTHSVRFGMRDVTREGHQVHLNGKPLYVRGMLHWGYYPHLFSIDPSEEQILREFADLRDAGFNLVKVCLFLFPQRFYELADETGMLIWQEYPIWLTMPKKNDEGPFDGIVREYAEWHRFDRNHPSVILRSLTCEAEDPHPGLIERLYNQAKDMTRGGLVADNSAYMNQMITDWYDAHMYLDLDDYHTHLVALSERLRKKPEIKPYMSGEEMDCDTYRDMDAVRRAWIKDGRVPWWLDNANFQIQERIERELIERHGAGVPARLVRAQNQHALITAKATSRISADTPNSPVTSCAVFETYQLRGRAFTATCPNRSGDPTNGCRSPENVPSYLNRLAVRTVSARTRRSSFPCSCPTSANRSTTCRSGGS